MTLLLFLAGAGESTPPAPAPSLPRVFSYAGYQPNQLTLAVFTPARAPFLPRSVFEGNYQEKVSAWQYEINAVGGYGAASFTLTDTERAVRDWYENGLGRHVECYNPQHRIVYAGFVNKVRINYGSLSAERGPLMEAPNRVSMLYTPLNIDVYPPVQGIPRVTTITQNFTAQAKFGIIERVLNGGTIPDADADQIQATYLQENSTPKTNNAELLLSNTQGLTITIECSGYGEWLRAYVYNQTATALSITIKAKIEALLAADPNGIFSSNYSKIALNSYLVTSYEGENRDALTILQGLLAIGDINDTRYLFGIYEKQQAQYNAVPSEIEYLQRLTDRNQQVMTIEGDYLHPWDVLPGKFLKYEDFTVGRLRPNLDRNDPRLMFIETVRFTAPNGLSLSGGNTDKLPQTLAKWGLGGL